MTARLRIPEPSRKLYRLALAAGWTVAHCRSGHLRWTAPSGASVITASTPGDRRTWLNERARLRRAGLNERKHAA